MAGLYVSPMASPNRGYSGFFEWAFDKRDLDFLIVAVLIAETIKLFSSTFVEGILTPLLSAFVNESNPKFTIRGTPVEFKINDLIRDVMRLAVVVWICYVLIHYRVVR